MNMQPGDGATTTQIVACAVWCCDKKNYVLKKKGRKVSQNCSRLGSKKHSCVTHALREHKNGKMTTRSKYPGVRVPKCAEPVRVDGETVMAKPDTILDGNRSVDAKFPCDSDKVKEINKGVGFGEPAIYRSERAGRTLMKDKEDKIYREIPGIKSSTTMTPERAEKVIHEDCECN
ncbi:MAG: hypothetical protein JSR59_15120 [Proteobacteria bacterium]|nr:hypothetical protein [Pseudomonadota bacterium]